MMAEYLLFATERYALPILAPLAQALQACGHAVSAWFEGGARGLALPGVR
ncbi:CDP-glycerol glycerophosphotransferase, partial [Xanthomonas oryzae pv. oryzae]